MGSSGVATLPARVHGGKATPNFSSRVSPRFGLIIEMPTAPAGNLECAAHNAVTFLSLLCTHSFVRGIGAKFQSHCMVLVLALIKAAWSLEIGWRYT
jgi:hypothetical protein